jgi:NADPH:quinone reductase-like Zn-dependent oxidoreductase
MRGDTALRSESLMPEESNNQMTAMKAVVLDRYGPPGDVLRLQKVDKPTVGEDGVLVRVHAAGVDPGIWHLVRGEAYIARLAFGLRKPKKQVLGRDAAGTVEAVGTNVTRLRPGDEVYAEVDGAFAEYTCVPEDVLGLKPANLTFEQAAAVPLSANTALQGLRDVGRVQPGQRVLINGASGGVGTYAVQIAKSLGADVTAVCSTRNMDLVRSIGADHVIDYTRENFTRSGRHYDLILDLIGNHRLSDFRRALARHGTLVLSSGNGGRWLGPIGRIMTALVLSPFVPQKLRPLVARRNRDNLVVLKELLESGKVTPVIDRTYPLNEAPEALSYVEQGHARGKVVIALHG